MTVDIEKKRKLKREELQNILKQNVENGKYINISKFRKKYTKEYSLLHHYFGNVENALNSIGAVKISTSSSANEEMTLRNQLAYDMIKKMKLEDKMTFSKIAKHYHVSRSALTNLFHRLESEK